MGLATEYIKPVQKIIFDKEFRTFLRLYYSLKSKPERQPGEASFDGYQVTYADAYSFIFQYKEIFANEAYRFKPDRANPLIIDCGANIGIGCLYFKKLFPGSKILAFEADEQIAVLLERNMQANQLQGVTVCHKAVWKDDQGMTFFSDGADGGGFYSENTANATLVPTIRLRDILLQHEKVDMLKIDIEGAETTVIKDCGEALQRVENMYIEYHSMVNQPQDLGKLLHVLEQNGLRYYIASVYPQDHPLIKPVLSNNMDLQLHIFALRKN